MPDNGFQALMNRPVRDFGSYLSGGLETEVRSIAFHEQPVWAQPLPAALSTPVESLLPCDPVVLGRHRLLGRLGQGGMGVVYLADGPMGLIAVKTIHAHLADDPSFHSRFQSEVQACFRVRGPHTAELVDFDVTAATPWLATEFVDAPDLEQLIRRDGALSGDAQYALALGLADALISLHDRGIVHRDLKPSNVLCPATGPRVIDFGIAAAVDEAGLTRTGSFVGTTAWMAPERIEGMTTPAADIYAWGALLAYAATGRPLFDDATPLQLMMMVANAQPHVDYDALDPRLRDAVASALARSPEFRPTAHQLRDLLTDPSHVRPVVHNVVPCPGPAPVEFASPPVVKLDHWAGRTSQFPWVDPFAKTYSAAQIGNREKAGSRRSRVTVAVLALVSLTAFVVAILLAGHGSPRILLLRLEAHPAFTASALTGAALATAVICWLLRRKRAARR